MKPPRGLTAGEAAAWAQVAATVTRLAPLPAGQGDHATNGEGAQAHGATSAPSPSRPPNPKVPSNPRPAAGGLPAHAGEDTRTLDATWDRKLARGTVQPDITLDLHGHTLDSAYDRLMGGLDQARAIGARTVLLIAGKPRPVAAADRGGARGAIRAKVLDWLAASRHHAAIAAVRKAHVRHGGEGALYIVLKRAR